VTNINHSLFFIRLGIGWLYLYAAFMNSRNKASLQWTRDNTAILFRNTSLAGNAGFIRLTAIGGLACMYVGGLSVLIGLEARIGAFLLLIFTVGGTVIHHRLKKDAGAIANNNQANATLTGVAWSAFSAHFANVLKNICLSLILIFLILYGSGSIVVSDLVGHFFY